MREYLKLNGGVQVQPYDLWWLSETAREGVKCLASIYGGQTVILSGFYPDNSVIGGGISSGVVLYDGLPVDVPGCSGMLVEGVAYKLTFEDIVLDATVFNGSGTKTQRPYKMVVGKIGTCKATDNEPNKLSSIPRINSVFHDMLKGLLVSREVSIASGYDTASVFRTSPTDPFNIRRQGNVVYMGGRLEFAQSPFELGPLFELITKIPSAYRPINNMYIECYGDTVNGLYQSYLLELTTSGVLRRRKVYDNPDGDVYDHIIINPITYFTR